MFSIGFTSFTTLLFFLYWSPSFYFAAIFDIISSNTDEIFSSINPYANVFFFGYLKVSHKDWLTYSARTDRLVNFVVMFLSQMT